MSDYIQTSIKQPPTKFIIQLELHSNVSFQFVRKMCLAFF